MYLDRSLPAKNRGFLLPSAIFLLVILSSLAGFLVTTSSSQHAGSAQDVVGARAYQSARSGLEWGFYHTLVTGFCPAEQDVALDATAFPGLSLTVKCEDVSAGAKEASVPVILYKITATACSQPNAAAPSCPNAAPNPTYVERQLEAVVER